MPTVHRVSRVGPAGLEPATNRIMSSLVARMFGDQNLIDDVAWRAMSFGPRRVLQRLGITPNEMNGGDCVALSRPKELAERLVAYEEEV